MTNNDNTIINLTSRRNTKASRVHGAERRHNAPAMSSARAAYRSDDVHAERVVMAREMLGFSQEDFAEVMNVALATYQQWERGETMPSIEQLRDLCETTGMFSIAWFCSPMDPGWPGIDETTLRFH